MKWQSLLRTHRVAALLIALLIAAGSILTRQAHAEPQNPPATKITVEVPSKATGAEIAARINNAINTLPAPTTVLSGSISLSQMESVTISLVENPALESITDTRTPPITASHIPTTTLEWANPNQPQNYCSASAEQLKPTLSFDANSTTLQLRVNGWINYTEVAGDDMFYDDFSVYTALITGTGSLPTSLPEYHERPGYSQEAFQSAFITAPGDHIYLNQNHYSVTCDKTNRVFLPIVTL
jgi:hypothetical protein